MSTEKIIVKVDLELQEIVPGFIDKRKKDLPDLWDCLNKKDFTTLQTLGHRLKGNAGGYGFDYIGSLGSEIEDGAKFKNAPKIEAAITELEDYLFRLEVVFEEAA